MSKDQKDDLEAVRTVVSTLEPFDGPDRERIIRWVREKLGMPVGGRAESAAARRADEPTGASPHAPGKTAKDIKTFVAEKNPTSDRQLAAVIAYYYAFEAPDAERKESIDAATLIDACRKAGRRRPPTPGQTLINATTAGYLDKTSDRGQYRLNSVGENLVAMVLPGTRGEASRQTRKGRPVKKSGRD